MAFSVTDIVNIEDNIKSLRQEIKDFTSNFHEMLLTLDNLEYFLSHYKDVVIHDPLQDDLPL